MFAYPLTFNTPEEHQQHIHAYHDFYSDALSQYYHPPKRQRIEEPAELAKLQQKIQSLEQSGAAEAKALRDQLVELGQANVELGRENAAGSQMLAALQNQKHEQDRELARTKEMFEDTIQLEELMNKKNGISVVHKGSCDEKYVEVILKEVVGEQYRVDNSNKTQQMDIRIHRVDGAFTIGVECKDKDTVTKADLDKFRRDKIRNKFYRSIFISTSPIKYIAEDNQVAIKHDELYIVTKDPVFLAAALKLYMCQLEETGSGEPDDMVFDSIMNTYQIWQASKKQLVKMDKAVLEMLGLHPDFEQKMIDKHLYMTTKSCLNAKFKF